MTQWIAIALILAACVLWIARRLLRSRKSRTGCSGCDAANCPNRRGGEPRRNHLRRKR